MIPVGLNTSYLTASVAANTTRSHNNFQKLMESLQAGDISGAQTAYAALTTQASNSAQTSSSTNSTLDSDLKAVGKALQSGDLTGARQAFAKLREDAKATAGSRMHYHHHWVGPAVTSAGASSTSSSTALTAGIDTTA
jgi:hypothetical protein